jgi:hypothetical protein
MSPETASDAVAPLGSPTDAADNDLPDRPQKR